MESITLGQIAAGGGFLVALVLAYRQLKTWTVEAIKSTIKDELGDLKDSIKGLKAELKKEDKEKTKNFIVARLSEIERGQEWSDIERQRFYEQYDHYTQDLNGNTYIKTAVEQYEKEGKIWR